jgi:opacity protein-like surface antigen
MKKILFVVALLAATMTAQAQGLKFGIKGGLNLTKMTFSKDVYSSDNQAGFYVGPTLKLSLPLGFGVDVAALYDQRSTKVDIIDVKNAPANDEGIKTVSSLDTYDIKQKSIQIPINVRYNIGLGSEAGIYLAVGPQFGFPVGDKVYNTKLGDYTLKSSNLSFNFGAGVYLLDHLEVGFSYNLAAGKSGEFTGYSDIDTHNNAWQIGAAIYF